MELRVFLILLQVLAICGIDEKGCMPPVNPYHGEYAPRQVKYLPEESIYYVCDEGYRVFGSAKRVCMKNGQWNQSAPYCSELLHGVSVDEKMWNVLLDGNYSSCTSNKSARLSFDFDKSFTEAVFRSYPLVNDAADLHVSVNNQPCERVTVPKGLHFQESKCSFANVERNTRPKIIVAHLTSSHFCEVEIYPVRELKCKILVSKPSTSITFEPSLESSYVNYGAAALHFCGEGYKLVGDQIRYCVNHNQWSGRESYCERSYSQLIVFLVFGAVGFVVLLCLCGIAIYLYRIKCKKSGLQKATSFDYEATYTSADMHYYSSVNYGQIQASCPQMTLPRCSANEYNEPVDKVESVVDNVYAVPQDDTAGSVAGNVYVDDKAESVVGNVYAVPQDDKAESVVGNVYAVPQGDKAESVVGNVYAVLEKDKAESVVGNICAVPQDACHDYHGYGLMANTLPVTSRTDNQETEFQHQNRNKRAVSLDVSNLKLMLRTDTEDNRNNFEDSQMDSLIKK